MVWIASWPNQSAITVMSTPRCKRSMAVEWRSVCGVTLLVCNEGHVLLAALICRATSLWSASELIGVPLAGQGVTKQMCRDVLGPLDTRLSHCLAHNMANGRWSRERHTGSGRTGIVVFHGVAFGAAGVQVIGISLALWAKNQRQLLQGAIVLQRFLRAIAGGMQQHGAKFQRRVVGDAKLPVGRDVAGGIRQIAFHDGQQVLDFFWAGCVRSQPAVTGPLFQAHVQFLSQKVSATPALRSQSDRGSPCASQIPPESSRAD